MLSHPQKGTSPDLFIHNFRPYLPKGRVKVRGLQAIDRRTSAARALLGWRKDLLDDLGGEDTVSAQQMALARRLSRPGSTSITWVPGSWNGAR